MLRGPSEVPGLPHTVGSTAPIGVDPTHRFLKNWSRLMMMMITVYFSYHMKPKPKARIAKSISIVSPMNNIRS